jgi:hypothetical protein
MAEWGSSGRAPKALFEKLIPKIEEVLGETDVNHLQCFSLSYWAVGNIARALQLRDEAASLFAGAPGTIFSAWSYLYRSPKEFRLDLDAMRVMYSAGDGKPAFIREVPSLL